MGSAHRLAPYPPESHCDRHSPRRAPREPALPGLQAVSQTCRPHRRAGEGRLPGAREVRGANLHRHGPRLLGGAWPARRRPRAAEWPRPGARALPARRRPGPAPLPARGLRHLRPRPPRGRGGPGRAAGAGGARGAAGVRAGGRACGGLAAGGEAQACPRHGAAGPSSAGPLLPGVPAGTQLHHGTAAAEADRRRPWPRRVRPPGRAHPGVASRMGATLPHRAEKVTLCQGHFRARSVIGCHATARSGCCGGCGRRGGPWRSAVGRGRLCGVRPELVARRSADTDGERWAGKRRALWEPEFPWLSGGGPGRGAHGHSH
mmetsp:Transcript_112363/g.358722  ORF Transcript_112363/g.358722 Transcript_112363/m.358722 type:complete len:318 (-) Transcript_112363:80-1033(-)